MPVQLAGKKLIPAPFFKLSREFNSRDDGATIGSLWLITLQGKIAANKGSPDSDGNFWTSSGYPPDESLTHDEMFRSILRKKKALAELFETDGALLEIQPWDGSAPLKCNPRVRSIDFPQGLDFNVADYSVTLEADVLYLAGAPLGEVDYPVSRASVDWAIEPADDTKRTFRLSHNVSAVGKRSYDSDGNLLREAVDNARLYVLETLGLGLVPARMEASGVLNANTLQAFNYVRSSREDLSSFSASENWLCFDPQGEAPAVENFSVNARLQADGITRVSIEGTVEGLEVRDNNTYALTTTKYANASTKWTDSIKTNLHTRAQNYSSLSLHSDPLSISVGYNENAGTINYQYEYDNRANLTIDGAISESINVNTTDPGDVFASIPVIGRMAGPVLQDMGARTEKRKTLSIEIQMPAKMQSFTPTEPNVNSIISSHIPTGDLVFQEPSQRNWSESTGRFSQTISWVWE